MPLVPCGCNGTGSCNYINCDGRKFEMPRGIPTHGGGVALAPGDTLYAIEHSKRLLAVERGGKVVGYTTVRAALYGPYDNELNLVNAPKDERGNFTGVDTIKAAEERGLGSWPLFVE